MQAIRVLTIDISRKLSREQQIIIGHLSYSAAKLWNINLILLNSNKDSEITFGIRTCILNQRKLYSKSSRLLGRTISKAILRLRQDFNPKTDTFLSGGRKTVSR